MTIGLAATALIASLCVPALALSLKGIMKQMSGNTSSGKALLSDFNAATAKAVLKRYAADARSAGSVATGKGAAQTRDLVERFDKMATTADAAAQGTLDEAAYRKAFLSIAADCKSCHSAYK